MAYLNTYSPVLTAQTAAHLLRRATFGPTQQEITALTGMTASQAVDILVSNALQHLAAPVSMPVEMEGGRPDTGQTFMDKPMNNSRTYEYGLYIRFWWIGLMTEQTGFPSVLEKLAAFWQNHFVVTQTVVMDHRLIFKYLQLLRNGCLGSFRNLAIEITKDPAMLVYQNGSENEKEHPNENYARELQELFTVGQLDFHGNLNYTEEDVKAAARVLTGWQLENYYKNGSTSFKSFFNPARHDTDPKTFSAKYNHTTITTLTNDINAGDLEVAALVDMLLRHPETPKFICRKLYRWYVNPNVNQDIETNVIAPLADFFASTSNNFAIAPVLKKLLTSDIFYDQSNRGAIIKSPAELMIGTIRFFNQPVPNQATEPVPFRIMMEFEQWRMSHMQLDFIDQPLVFGSVPYYQTGYSKNWINSTTIGRRSAFTDALVYPWLVVKPGYILGIDLIGWLTSMQPNFADVSGTAAISCVEVLDGFTKNLFAIDLTQVQKDLLIDTIMMRSIPRTSWIREWNAYRSSPADDSKRDPILWRVQPLMVYLFRMAEYQIF